MSGSFAQPVYEGEITGPCLAVDAHAFDPDGNEVIGELGELVITQPMPSMPVAFWGDEDGERYRSSYFDVYPGVWRQGDWIKFTERGSCIITGRSDATLNRGGVRLGTGEFYAVVEDVPEVIDALVVHLEDSGGGAGELLLFVVPADGAMLDDDAARPDREGAPQRAVAAARARRDRRRCPRSRERSRGRSSRRRSSGSCAASPRSASPAATRFRIPGRSTRSSRSPTSVRCAKRAVPSAWDRRPRGRSTERTFAWRRRLHRMWRQSRRFANRSAGESPEATSSSRLDSWSEILAATHLAFEVHATDRTPADFRGSVTRRPIGDLMLVDCAASPFLGHRSRAVMSPKAKHEDILGFQIVCKGVETVSEGARGLALSPGDVVLWDGQQPTDVEIVEAFHKRTLLFPRDRVLAVCPRLAELRALPPLDDNGPARLLVRYMNALALEQPKLAAAAGVAAANAALELLRAAVEPCVPTSRAAAREAMRAEIRRYARTHLQDPELGPASIARAYSISVRALHALFEDVDASVAGLVRTERLARCLEDLQRPNGGSVTDIAFRWGFCDAAHFSRVFKRAFGVTPSDVRHAAQRGERVAPDRSAHGLTLTAGSDSTSVPEGCVEFLPLSAGLLSTGWRVSANFNGRRRVAGVAVAVLLMADPVIAWRRAAPHIGGGTLQAAANHGAM